MDFTGLCQKMVILFFCMAAGFVAAKAKVMDVQSNKKLSSLVVNVSNPMQIFASALTGEHVLSNRQTLGLTGIISGDLCVADRPELCRAEASARAEGAEGRIPLHVHFR